MNGHKDILLDTNAVLYLLGGNIASQHIAEGVYHISIITELELLSYPGISKSEEASLKSFIEDINTVNIDDEIKDQAIRLRKKYKIKLPDAIICATASTMNATLITFDKALLKIKEIKSMMFQN